MGRRGAQYLRLHHVHSPGPQLPDAVVDVHHPFPFRHVQHDVDDDEAAGPPGASTEWRDVSVRGGKGPPALLLFLKKILLWRISHHIKRTIESVRFSGISHLHNGVLSPPPLGPAACSPPKGGPRPPPMCPAAHLQCTTNGPELGGLLDLTCRTNPSSPVAW